MPDAGLAPRPVMAGSRVWAITGALLGLLAVAELLARSVGAGWGWQFLLVVCLLGLSTTLPLAFPRPAAAAVAAAAAVTAALAVVQALTLAHATHPVIAGYQLTFAGLAAQVVAAYRLGRSGAHVLAVAIDTPFLALALTGVAAASAGPIARVGSADLQTLAHPARSALLGLPALLDAPVLLAALVPAAALAGSARRARREERESRAAQQAVTDTLVAHAARGERARIVRELHDVVAHHVSMIAVQAETARLTTPGMPAAGAERLSAIGHTARAALTEMRRLLGVLREDTRDEPVGRRPQPGLIQLNELLDEAREVAGTAVRLILRGPMISLDPGVELAAYRIVQEALTNARRHAPGAAVDVELHYVEDTLRLRIRDNGPGPAEAPLVGGHGLAGMEGRVAAVGGTLRTGPAVGGGFLVEASLPAKEAAQ